MNIREQTTSQELKEEVRNTMIQFWESYDKLLVDMDNLTEDEFNIRQHEMWGFRNKAFDYGEYFIISLWWMSEKAEKLYGVGTSSRYVEFLNKINSKQ
jgi:hypothetical protein